MSVKITYEFATIDEAITHLAKNRGDAPKVEVPKPAGAKAEKVAKSEPAAPAPTASAAPAAAPSTPPSGSTAQVDYASIAERITKGVATHRAEVVALLAKFGAKNGKELKPEQYADFAAQMDELLKPEEALA